MRLHAGFTWRGSFTYKWKLPITRGWPHLFWRTDRQARLASTHCRITPNYHISISTSALSNKCSSSPRFLFFFFLLLFFFLPLSPPEGISVIGNGEFKRAVIACARHPDSNPPYWIRERGFVLGAKLRQCRKYLRDYSPSGTQNWNRKRFCHLAVTALYPANIL